MSNAEFKEGFLMVWIIVLIVLAAVWMSEKSCLTKGRSFDGVEYTIIGGCMVNHKGRWLPLDNIRGFDGN